MILADLLVASALALVAVILLLGLAYRAGFRTGYNEGKKAGKAILAAKYLQEFGR